MLTQAVPADMHAVDAAVNHRRFGSAQVATAADRLGRCMQCPGLTGGHRHFGFQVQAAGGDERSEGEGADARSQDGLIFVFPERGGNEA